MALTALLSHTTSTIVLGLLPLVLAHGGEHGETHEGDTPQDRTEYPASYFANPSHVGLIYSHIALMVAAWVFVLPVAVMLSLARSRYALDLQFVFLVTNALGLLLGGIYNAKTPDLYPNNAHHKIGWAVTWIVSAHVLVSAVGRIAGVFRGTKSLAGSEGRGFVPLSTEAMHESQFRTRDDHKDQYRFSSPSRLSDDSGHGTEYSPESSRSSSCSTMNGVDDIPLNSPKKEYEDADNLEEMALFPPSWKSGLARQAVKLVHFRIWRYLDIGYRVFDRILLPFGFVALTTGVVTFGRFFEGSEIFGGLAHWVKGGVFFWLGLFTLGRWSGSFAELGWAWNARPKRSTRIWRPSAEFVESALIFFYGSTNIFLEHLGGWGGSWTAQDMEHISITVLFIGGGLCGMLIESTRVRDLLNTSVVDTKSEHPYSEEDGKQWQPPATYEFSLNPIPALVILLLGIMMSSHTQASMISSMVHKQWGNLLLGASFARCLTYVLMCLKPPHSILPSRPPTELLVSFGLISGGVIFMASAGDTVDGMIHYELDAMFMYTVTMGLVGLLMAWEIVVLAIKGWAVRREGYNKFQRT
ncbi:Fc.00g013320.m01.CDS01 [Cosmosporella sp. VM-42]